MENEARLATWCIALAAAYCCLAHCTRHVLPAHLCAEGSRTEDRDTCSVTEFEVVDEFAIEREGSPQHSPKFCQLTPQFIH